MLQGDFGTPPTEGTIINLFLAKKQKRFRYGPFKK
jgi:hypothetical protein